MAPAPFLCCDPGLTIDGGGVISDPDRIDAKLGSLSFVGLARDAVDLSDFDREVGGWLVVWTVGSGGTLRLFLSPGLTGWLLFSLGLSWMVSGRMVSLMLMLL